MPGRISAHSARLAIGAIGAGGLALDLATKMLAVELLDPVNPVRLLGGLVTLRLIRNPGAAFSMGEGVTPLFSVLAVIAIAVVVGWLAPRVRVRSWAVATGLLVAGITGNLVDRVFRAPGFLHGHVVDFIQLPYFAIFNVADMCLTAAAGLIIVLSLGDRASYDGTVRHGSAACASEAPGAAGGPATGGPEPSPVPAGTDDQEDAR